MMVYEGALQRKRRRDFSLICAVCRVNKDQQPSVCNIILVGLIKDFQSPSGMLALPFGLFETGKRRDGQDHCSYPSVVVNRCAAFRTLVIVNEK